MYSRRTASRLHRKVRVAPAQRRPDAPEHAAELLTKGGVAERIEERVQRGVEVAYPRHGRHELHVDPVGAHGHHRETDEVRQEADCKRAPVSDQTVPLLFTM